MSDQRTDDIIDQVYAPLLAHWAAQELRRAVEEEESRSRYDERPSVLSPEGFADFVREWASKHNIDYPTR